MVFKECIKMVIFFILVYLIFCGGKCGENVFCRKGVCVCKFSCYGNLYINCVKDVKVKG